MRTAHLPAYVLLLVALGLLPVVLGAAPAVASPSSGPPVQSGTGPDWAWPLSPRPTVMRGFDPPDKPWLSGHRGVDLQAADDGATVAAPAGGTVGFVGVVVDRPVITIDHGNGLRSSFEPVDSELEEGAPVAKGQAIGVVESRPLRGISVPPLGSSVRGGLCEPACLRHGSPAVSVAASGRLVGAGRAAGAARLTAARRWRKSR